MPTRRRGVSQSLIIDDRKGLGVDQTDILWVVQWEKAEEFAECLDADLNDESENTNKIKKKSFDMKYKTKM